MSSYFVTYTVLFHLIHVTVLWGKYYFRLYFVDQKTGILGSCCFFRDIQLIRVIDSSIILCFSDGRICTHYPLQLPRNNDRDIVNVEFIHFFGQLSRIRNEVKLRWDVWEHAWDTQCHYSPVLSVIILWVNFSEITKSYIHT